MEACNNRKSEGTVFNIQHFTVHDGPGIRTEVFLKGCSLHCKWCSNPESFKLQQEVGIYTNRCIGVDKCGYCMKVCPVQNALIMKDNKIVGINKENCMNCLLCVDACPSNALKLWGKKMTSEAVMKELLADRDIYKKSGGGVTFSGGEALVQWEFVLELLKQCKKMGIHTCVETAFYCKSEILDEILPFTDMIITDIKHMDDDQHKCYTGKSNTLILKNIKKVVETGKPVIIRIPVIPEHNNSEENIRATAEFICHELNNQVKQVQLLRYHRLGEEKYESLSLEYPMSELEYPEPVAFEKEIQGLVEIMKSYGISAVAGSTSKLD